jgi:hypothetical protein
LSEKDQNASHSPHPQPPQPPDFRRELHFYPYQLIGIPLLVLIPILALLGVLSHMEKTVNAANADFDVQLQYPTRCFYRMNNTIELTIRNTSSQAMPTITVSLDKSYMHAFDAIQFTPDSVMLTDTAYVVDLQDVGPGEARSISIDYEPSRYWQHQGNLMVSASEAEPIIVPLETFVFP